MRQVSRDELIYKVAAALRTASPALVRGLSTGGQEAVTRNRVMLATMIVDRTMREFEILSDQPLPMMGEATYSRPLANMMGEAAVPLAYDDTQP